MAREARAPLAAALPERTTGEPASEGQSYPLWTAHPRLGERLPREVLASLPTPIDEAVDLAAALGLGRLFLKRDDKSAGYGGGKARKLELFLGAARSQHKTRLVTFGGVGSNQALATAYFGHQRGFDVRLHLITEPRSARIREQLRADASFGAELLLAGSSEHARQRAIASSEPADYVIPIGGTSPLGNVGFINAAFELRSQIERGLLPVPDRIVLAMGSMGSAVGLSIGLLAAGVKTQVVAVRASSEATSSQRKLEQSFAETVEFVCAACPTFPRVAYEARGLAVDGRELGAGYGQTTAKATQAAELALRHGVSLDPVYTQKAFASLLPRIAEREREVVLFWLSHHAGPVPRGPFTAALPKAFLGYELP